MEREIVGSRNSQTNQQNDGYIVPKDSLIPNASQMAKESNFATVYISADDLETKYSIAIGLAGKEIDPRFLLSNFIPREGSPKKPKRSTDGKVIRDGNSKPIYEEMHPEEATRLRDSLSFYLLQKGLISPKDKEAHGAVDHLERLFKSDQQIQDLVNSGVPVEVLGQIMTVREFSQISDQAKLEELRSWTTNAMLRPYLGVLEGRLPKRELNISDIMDRIPGEIFDNPNALRYHLIERYFEQHLMKYITDSGLEKGMKEVEQVLEKVEGADKKIFMQQIYIRLMDVATFHLKGDFKGKILVKGQERSFPSFEQKAFVYDFIHSDTRLLAADTGLGKTAAAYLAMENSDAERVLIVPPANGRETWVHEEQVVFAHPGNVFVVNKSSDLERAKSCGKKYIVIGQELLGLAETDQDLFKNLKDLVTQSKIDGAIFDEIDNLSNPNAISTRTTISLIEIIRTNFRERTGKDTDAPIIGLTATPIRGDLSDLNVPMGILYPGRYAVALGDETRNRKTFRDAFLGRPDLAYIELSGNRRMFRWEKASGVQEISYKPISIQVSPFEQLLYEFIGEEVGTDALNKIRILEDALLNPLLVKAEVRRLANGKLVEIDIDNALEILKKTVDVWKQMRGVDEPETEEDYLSIDRLVELGFKDLVLGSFFSNLLENGLDTLVDEYTKGTKDPQLQLLGRFWKPKELSSKYQELKNQIQKALSWRTGEDGRLHRNKVMIISPTKKQGRLGDVLQRKVTGENGIEEDLYADYELDKINDSTLIKLLSEWTKDLRGLNDILLLDGSVSIGRERNTVIGRWVNSPDDAILFGTLEAMYQSRDFTINTVVDKEGRQIDGVTKIFLHWPWYWQQFKQMVGRSQRQGQIVPVDTLILQARDLIDQGKGDTVRYTQLLSRIALSGVSLNPEDKEFFDSNRVGRSKIRFQSRDARFLRDILSIVRGMGEEDTGRLMSASLLDDQKTNYERFAERFFDEGKDEYRTSGYNSELVAFLIKQLNFSEKRILSLGAGTLLLQRKLKKGIDNVDMNKYAMNAGWKLASEFGGRMIMTKASVLNRDDFIDSSYDTVDSSFALHWSKLGDEVEKSERVAILNQIHRVLKTGGAFFLTMPDGTFDDEKFQSFITALETSFGFRVDRQYSGKSYGISKIGSIKRLGWSIVAFKERPVNLGGINLEDLQFMGDDQNYISRDPKKKNGDSIVRGGDYPKPDIQLRFDRYQIVNADNEVSTILGEQMREKPSTMFDETSRFLRGQMKEDYEAYRRYLIRPLMQIANMNWEQAEGLAIKTLMEIAQNEKRMPNPKDRRQIFRLIQRLIVKQMDKEGNNVN